MPSATTVVVELSVCVARRARPGHCRVRSEPLLLTVCMCVPYVVVARPTMCINFVYYVPSLVPDGSLQLWV